ncbi:putative assembly chaperone of rpl4 [Vanrija pseudolonga]|uniref:Assembly chaperone of rpl4 n=1 Tax=Vanrija pseudolonga TaxID=143232 RepID=A0AAF0YBP0_9TREE|nr:putative assembly chaperone of rpl4 [Vanrija pseudolonga]
MVKTKSKARKGAVAKAPKPAPSGSAADVPGLIDKAHVLLAQSNFDLAIKFLERALQLEPTNLEARELLGVAELEEGDGDKGREGRQHLLHLFPPHTAEPPSSPSPYLYLAQSASEPQEALGYYSTAAAMIENKLNGKGKGKAADPAEVEEERRMAVTSLIAMIEIWMSDLCFEAEASNNCDALIARAVSVAPNDPEVLLTLASIRLSQSKFDEAKATILQVYSDLEGRDPFDPMLPGLPVRLTFARLLLEHHLHLEALDILSTVREEDSLEVEGAYLEGWAYHLRGEAVEADPTLLAAASNDDNDEDKPLTVAENYAESMRALLEAAKLFTEQEYPDEGIGAHIQELLKGLEARGVQPAVNEEAEDDAADEGGWEDVEGDGDVEMA